MKSIIGLGLVGTSLPWLGSLASEFLNPFNDSRASVKVRDWREYLGYRWKDPPMIDYRGHPRRNVERMVGYPEFSSGSPSTLAEVRKQYPGAIGIDQATWRDRFREATMGDKRPIVAASDHTPGMVRAWNRRMAWMPKRGHKLAMLSLVFGGIFAGGTYIVNRASTPSATEVAPPAAPAATNAAPATSPASAPDLVSFDGCERAPRAGE